MTERIYSRFENNRFLGDEAEMVVLDLENENTSGQGCYTDEIIKKRNAACFFPDSIEEVNQQGYNNCERCLGKRSVHFHTKLIIEE